MTHESVVVVGVIVSEDEQRRIFGHRDEPVSEIPLHRLRIHIDGDPEALDDLAHARCFGIEEDARCRHRLVIGPFRRGRHERQTRLAGSGAGRGPGHRLLRRCGLRHSHHDAFGHRTCPFRTAVRGTVTPMLSTARAWHIPGRGTLDDMEDWVDDAAEQLEKLTGDPMAGAARGTVTVLTVSAPDGRARYQECRLRLRATGADVADAIVETAVVVDRRHWPRVGAALPARISRTHPGTVDVNWDALARGG